MNYSEASYHPDNGLKSSAAHLKSTSTRSTQSQRKCKEALFYPSRRQFEALIILQSDLKYPYFLFSALFSFLNIIFKARNTDLPRVSALLSHAPSCGLDHLQMPYLAPPISYLTQSLLGCCQVLIRCKIHYFMSVDTLIMA